VEELHRKMLRLGARGTEEGGREAGRDRNRGCQNRGKGRQKET
jgi:hypothetical protein